MIITIFSVLAVVIIGAGAVMQLVISNWRLRIFTLAAQYMGVFWLINLIWPLGLAAVKLVVGWMVCALLGSTETLDEQEGKMYLSARILGLLTAGVIVIMVFIMTPAIARWLPTGSVILWGGFLLLGLGVLQLGMSTQVSRVLIGLLNFLAGFEILYSAVEYSVLVTGLLAVINLGLALTGTYLMTRFPQGERS